MKMLGIPPKRLVNRYVSSRELERYFGSNSAEALVVSLRQGRQESLFRFSITLDPEYVDWGEAKYKAQFPVDFHGANLGFVRVPRYKLESLSSKIAEGEALSEDEIQKVISELPHDIMEKFLRFKLSNLDYDALKDIMPKNRPNRKKDTYTRIEREGLVIDETEVSYNGKPISLSFQYRQVLQVLLDHYGKLVAHDVFTNNRDIFPKEAYKKDLNVRIAQIISELNKKLKTIVGQSCIENTSSEGWTLKIQ
ncbi:MAG: hypothetical protein WC549_08125 [Actinomycetota bacterium]